MDHPHQHCDSFAMEMEDDIEATNLVLSTPVQGAHGNGAAEPQHQHFDNTTSFDDSSTAGIIYAGPAHASSTSYVPVYNNQGFNPSFGNAAEPGYYAAPGNVVPVYDQFAVDAGPAYNPTPADVAPGYGPYSMTNSLVDYFEYLGDPLPASPNAIAGFENLYPPPTTSPQYSLPANDEAVISDPAPASVEPGTGPGLLPYYAPVNTGIQQLAAGQYDNITINNATNMMDNGNGNGNGTVDDKTCPVYQKTFSRSADQRRHQGKHNEAARIYKCTVAGCDVRGAYRKDKLLSHEKNCHAQLGH